MPGDLGDARFNLYILEHFWQYAQGATPSYWNAPFFYPESQTIAYSDNLLGIAPLYAFFRLFGLLPETAFQLWFVCITSLNFVFAYWAFRALNIGSVGASAGAFVFAFSIALQSQLTHAQTYSRFAVPMALVALWQFLHSQQAKHLLLACLFWVWQVYASIYTGYFLGVAMGFLLLAFVVVHPKRALEWLNSRQKVFYLGLSLALTALALWPLLQPYWQQSKHLQLPDVQYVLKQLPTWRSYFNAHYGSPWFNWLDQSRYFEATYDQQLFWGFGAWIGALSLLAFGIKKRWLPLALAALGLAVFFMQLEGISLYAFWLKLPAVSSIRALPRLVNVLLFFPALGLALAIGKLEALKVKNWVVVPVLAIFLLADNYVDSSKAYTHSKHVAMQRRLALQAKMAHLPPNSVVAYMPVTKTDPAIYYQLDAMLAAQSLQLKCINGYSAQSPYEYYVFWDELSEEGLKRWLKWKQSVYMPIAIIQ